MDRTEPRRPPAESVPPSATSVPDAETPVRCPYCERPFREPRLRTLHLGLEHDDRLDDMHRTAFETAYLEEEAEIRRLRLWLLAAVILVYFGLLFTYAVVT